MPKKRRYPSSNADSISRLVLKESGDGRIEHKVDITNPVDDMQVPGIPEDGTHSRGGPSSAYYNNIPLGQKYLDKFDWGLSFIIFCM